MNEEAGLVAAGSEPAATPDKSWAKPVERARATLAEGRIDAFIRRDDNLRIAQEGRPGDMRRGAQLLSLYRSLIVWKRDQRFEAPFRSDLAARVQLWELDRFCPDVGYIRAFLAEAMRRFGVHRGYAMFDRMLPLLAETPALFRIDERTDIAIKRRAGARLTILGCSGLRDQYAGISWRLFDGIVAERLNANLIAIRDTGRQLYLDGLASIGGYPQTISALREMLAEFDDTHIVATGGSAGVFGAIHIAADVGIRHVVAMAGPTSIAIGKGNEDKQIYQRVAADIAAGRLARPDLVAKVNDSALERIDFFVAGGHDFDMAQMRALADHCPVVRPRIYEQQSGHIVTDLAIEDGSMFAAFEAPLAEPPNSGIRAIA